jgi:hypothetical protein
MAHRVTAISTKASLLRVSIMVKSQFFVDGSMVIAMCCVVSSLIKAHKHCDMLHSRRECRHESVAPHMEQLLVSAIMALITER